MMRYILICLFIVGASSCASTGPAALGSVSYSESARQNYDMGVKALEDANYEQALAYFEYVRNKYPYSKYAGESDLKIADAYFADEKWLQAADAYDFFVRFHPVHESVAYGTFRAAKANINAIPSDFFLYPPSYTKDQTATKDALSALDRFIEQFPKDENVTEAQDLRIKLREQIAQQHIYVAKYYVKLSKWRGAAQRYEEVVKDYADTPSAAPAFLALAYLKKDRLNDFDEAKNLLQKVETDYPESQEAQTAKQLLKDLSATASKD